MLNTLCPCCAQSPAPWHCQHVEVTSTASGEAWLFPCNAWLGSSSGLAVAKAQLAAQQPVCEPSRLLLPAASLEGLFRQLQEEQELQQRREQYKVAVYTSAQSPIQGQADLWVDCCYLSLQSVCASQADEADAGCCPPRAELASSIQNWILLLTCVFLQAVLLP